MCETKFCKKCNTETERDKRGTCKPCVKARNAAWRAANPEKLKSIKAAWRVSNPESARASRAAWKAANREKEKARGVAWVSANREKVNTKNAAWRAANRELTRVYYSNRRARKRDVGGKLSTGLADRLFKLQRGKCACCGLPLGDNYHLDHIMPLALEGPNTDDNMQLLRATCNQEKWKKHPVDFMQQRGFLL